VDEKNQARERSASRNRRRRTTQEVLDQLVEAACEEFEVNGYTRTKTANIAKKAGVSETLLFKHFGSKANLFHDTIFNAFNTHFAEFQRAHPVADGDAAARLDVTKQYIGEVQSFFAQHSRMLMLLITSYSYETTEVKGIEDIEGLHDYLQTTATMIESRLEQAPVFDPLLTASIAFSTILSCVLFKGWLFPPGVGDSQAMNAAVINFVLGGVSANTSQEPLSL
jgi:AcrR family transcriptional regulator